MVVVYYLWFYFHRKGLTNANYPHHHSLPHGVVCSCSSGITKELQGQGLGRKLRWRPLQRSYPKTTRIITALIFSRAQDLKWTMYYDDLQDRPIINTTTRIRTRQVLNEKNHSCGWLWGLTIPTTTFVVWRTLQLVPEIGWMVLPQQGRRRSGVFLFEDCVGTWIKKFPPFLLGIGVKGLRVL